MPDFGLIYLCWPSLVYYVMIIAAMSSPRKRETHLVYMKQIK